MRAKITKYLKLRQGLPYEWRRYATEAVLEYESTHTQLPMPLSPLFIEHKKSLEVTYNFGEEILNIHDFKD